jgi:hypothetical protein
MPSDASPGIPGWFIAIIVIVVLLGIAGTIWRITVTRRMARDSGLDPNTATAVSLLSNDGIDAAYLASTLRQRPHSPEAQQIRSAEQRLQELKGLLDRNVITQDEYDTRRRSILDSI